MNPRIPNQLRFRASTAFLVLSLFCLFLEYLPPWKPLVFVGQAFSIPVVTVVFGQLGPIWALIGAALALVLLAANFRNLFAVAQHGFEAVLCLGVVILFPVY